MDDLADQDELAIRTLIVVPYWTTGVFGREADGWTWRYRGGSEPQAEPRV